MGKIITKTFEEIDREWTPEKIRAMLDAAPVFDDDITEEDIATGRVRDIGRGFEACIEYLNRNGYPNFGKSAVKTDTVTMPLPENVETGPVNHAFAK
jgi:hypothetical protein